MNSYYEEFLKRLVQYRIRLNMTQETISRQLGITQSQLSKQELGKIIVPYKSLVSFMKMGWDVDYLLTGKSFRREESKLTDMLNDVEEVNYKPMLEFIAWTLAKKNKKSASGLSMEDQCEICILKMKCNEDTDESIMYEIRKIAGEAQIAMAERLGVNIKKYRALEKEQVFPDAELLLGIYEITGCRPSLFLMDDHIEDVIIDDLWSRVDSERRKEILAIISQVEQFMRT